MHNHLREPMIDSQYQIQEDVIFTGDAYRKRLFDLVQNTQKEILISSYIFESDDFGDLVFLALQEKAKMGVDVKICVDGYGSRDWFGELDEHDFGPHLEVRVYHPLPWPFSRLFPADISHLNQIFELMYQANIRNHQKLIIVDRTIVILGSRNVHDEALHWRETSIEFTGPPVNDAVNVFFNLWDRAHTRKLKRSIQDRLTHHPIQSDRLFSNHFPALRKNRNYALINRIYGAKKSIFVTTPYFLPTPLVLKLLCQKAKSGIDVVVLLPNLIDVKLSKWLARSYYYLMLKSGIKIYEYTAEILHAKTIIIDDWAMVGSSNLNHRSTIRDLEIDYSPIHEKTLHTLKRKFHEDISFSIRMAKVVPINIFLRLLLGLISKLFHSWF